MSFPLTIQDLFTPAPSGIGQAVPPTGSWLETELQAAQTVQLQATAWQPGSVVRSVMAIMAACYAESDAIISLMAQGGFLDFAANGTVTYVTAQGNTITQYVTPDPSVPAQNPTGALGWLDLLADSVYSVRRVQPTAAAGALAIVNTTGSTYAYGAGAYHVASTTANYTAQEAVSIVPSTSHAVAGGGSAPSWSGGLWTINTTTAHGLTTGSVVRFVGTGLTALDNAFYVVVSTPTAGQFTMSGLAGSGSFTSSTALVYTAQQSVIQSDIAGPSGNATPGQVNTAITTNVGVSVWNPTNMTGLPWESNAGVVNRCRLKLQALSTMGAAGSYVFYALQAATILEETGVTVPGVAPGTSLINNPATRAVAQTNPTTGLVYVWVYGASSALDGSTANPITAATNAGPIQVTFLNAHGMLTGDYCNLTGVQGNTAANGWWQVTVKDANNVYLNGSVGNGAYTSGGQGECGDLGLTDYVVQSYSTPQTVTEITQDGATVAVTVAATVYVPAQYLSTYQGTAAPLAVQTAIGLSPIGGFVLPGYGSGVLPLGAMIQALYAAGGSPSYVKEVVVSSVTINGANADLSLATNEVPVFSALNLTVIPV